MAALVAFEQVTPFGAPCHHAAPSYALPVDPLPSDQALWETCGVVDPVEDVQVAQALSLADAAVVCFCILQ